METGAEYKFEEVITLDKAGNGNRWILIVKDTVYIYLMYFRTIILFGDPCGNRTRVVGVRGRSLNRLTNGPWSLLPEQGVLVRHQGLEPGTR